MYYRTEEYDAKTCDWHALATASRSEKAQLGRLERIHQQSPDRPLRVVEATMAKGRPLRVLRFVGIVERVYSRHGPESPDARASDARRHDGSS